MRLFQHSRSGQARKALLHRAVGATEFGRGALADRDEKYFVLHAPRQTGKTSTLLALRDLLNAEGHYRCVYANVEVGQAAREDTQRAIGRSLANWPCAPSRPLQDEFVEEVWFDILQRSGPDGAFRQVISRGRQPIQGRWSC